MNEKKPKPNNAAKACKNLMMFLHGQIFHKKPTAVDESGPSVFYGKVTIEVDQCCLEALAFAVDTTITAGVLDHWQQCCLAGVMKQIRGQIPQENMSLMDGASRDAARRLKARIRSMLFTAAMNSPSTQ